MKLIESFEEYCQKHDVTPEDVLPDVSKVKERHRQAVLDTNKMYLIAEDLNEGWEPDWNDSDEEKWIPWFDMQVDDNNPSGFRFGDSCCDFTSTAAGGGSRLCFKTKKLSDYAGKQFEQYWKNMMVIPK